MFIIGTLGERGGGLGGEGLARTYHHTLLPPPSAISMKQNQFGEGNAVSGRVAASFHGLAQR